jgi:hypothetical protein
MDMTDRRERFEWFKLMDINFCPVCLKTIEDGEPVWHAVDYKYLPEFHAAVFMIANICQTCQRTHQWRLFRCCTTYVLSGKKDKLPEACPACGKKPQRWRVTNWGVSPIDPEEVSS